MLFFFLSSHQRYKAEALTPNLSQRLSVEHKRQGGGKADDSMVDMQALMEDMVLEGQRKICDRIEEIDGEGTFQVDRWQRTQGGGGISCVLQGGKVFEKVPCHTANI